MIIFLFLYSNPLTLFIAHTFLAMHREEYYNREPTACCWMYQVLSSLLLVAGT